MLFPIVTHLSVDGAEGGTDDHPRRGRAAPTGLKHLVRNHDPRSPQPAPSRQSEVLGALPVLLGHLLALGAAWSSAQKGGAGISPPRAP